MTITVSTDGSALGNPNGPMGWAWADHTPHAGGRPGHEHGGDCDAGGATNGTNQIGELCAVLEALRTHPGAEPLVIETDSQYAINCSTKWVHGWKKNGWKNSQRKPVKNAALIKAIDAELSRRAGSVKFVWVKGHAGNAGNEKVDELARTYAGDCRSGVRDGYLPKEGWESLLASEYAKGTDVPADARMLMDGLISAKDYHLGRGEDSGDADAADVTETRDGRPSSVADALAEPEGVPEYPDYRTASDHANDDHAEADHTDDNESAATTTTSGTDTIVNHDDTTDNTTVASIDVTTDAPSETTAPRSTAAANASQPSAIRLTPQPSGLTVSGTLRFAPPPSSSPTYDGRPRMIRGYVMVEGYVNGDGSITLDHAPFAIRQS
ncbi:ribonuclease H [Bifidobacterium ramosum]|uniref:ribonuclease H n=1 Tax=Bifidobacterium ramosum TaxID=1798158 RepID=A0A6L4X101_9BIFI|nr:ribonuclease H [Bifidobacterium ramosum]KAB8288071.1 ribonuclease H [Bifidobacterium ramosum]NEG72709.1 ribonuclease HI [Bifidobacterium ramosum]